MRGLLAALAALLPAVAFAALSPGEMLADPAQEARARALSQELRCLVCQNQSIDDSDAELAQDLRRIVRERIEAGDSDEAIRAFLVARYGDFVLLRPPVRAETFLLWFGPAAVLALGGVAIAVWLRNRRREDEAPLSEAEARELQRLLDDDGQVRP